MAGACDPARIGPARNVAIWAFHGEKDATIPLERMHEMVAPRAAHGQPMFTIYHNGAHYDSKKGSMTPTSSAGCSRSGGTARDVVR